MATAAAHTLYEAAFVFPDPGRISEIVQTGLLRQPVVEALIQGLHGRGSISIEGALYLLARHRLAGLADLTDLRHLMAVLNAVGIVAFSNKHQTVRVLAEPSDGDAAAPSVRVIERDRPYSNVMHLRQTLRACRGHIHWAEPHLPRKVLESLVLEADSARISKIKLLSGPKAIDDRTRKDWKRFATEMDHLGIEAEWRVVADGLLALHDRYIIGRDKTWNVPPINSLHKGDYSEILATPTRPPFAKWWEEGVALQT